MKVKLEYHYLFLGEELQQDKQKVQGGLLWWPQHHSQHWPEKCVPLLKSPPLWGSTKPQRKLPEVPEGCLQTPWYALQYYKCLMNTLFQIHSKSPSTAEDERYNAFNVKKYFFISGLSECYMLLTLFFNVQIWSLKILKRILRKE